MDDLQIVDLYFERSENAIKETNAKYGRLCRSISINILGNEADSEECVSDTYLSLWNTIPPNRPRNLAAFISKIVRNLSLKRVRFACTAKRSAMTVVSLSELEDIIPDRYAEMEEEQLVKLIGEFLREQSADARNVFIREYWFFDTVADIAKRYSFSEGKVKSMLYHTRNKLRKYLEEEGIFP